MTKTGKSFVLKVVDDPVSEKPRFNTDDPETVKAWSSSMAEEAQPWLRKVANGLLEQVSEPDGLRPLPRVEQVKLALLGQLCEHGRDHWHCELCMITRLQRFMHFKSSPGDPP